MRVIKFLCDFTVMFDVCYRVTGERNLWDLEMSLPSVSHKGKQLVK